MSADVSAAAHASKRNRVIIPDDDGLLREFIILQSHQFSNRTKKVKTIASYTELRKQKLIVPTVLDSQTVNTSMDWGLDGTEWQRGITEYAGIRKVNIDTHKDAFQVLKQLASLFDLELRFRVEHDGNQIIGRYVDMVKKRGEDTKKEIELGKDLIGVERIEQQDIVTALIVLGPERDDGTRLTVTVEDEDARQRWGRKGKHLWAYYEPQTEEEDITIERLTQLGRQQLDKMINTAVEYIVTVVALEHIFGLSHEKVRLGDNNRVKDTSFSPPLYLDARIIELRRSISDKTKRNYVLGDFIEYSEEDIMKTFKQLQILYGTRVIKSPTEPSNPKQGMIWIDTSGPLNVMYTWNSATKSWEKNTPTSAEEVGAYDKETVDQKDESVYQDSTIYADQVSENAKEEAIQTAQEFTESIKQRIEEELRITAELTEVAIAQAERDAKEFTEGLATQLEIEVKAHANAVAITEALAAKEAAEFVAKAFATTQAELKANEAKQVAINAAALDAKQKADAAELAAKNFAASQITNAENNAKAHAESQAQAAKVAAQVFTESYAEKAMHVGNSAPPDTTKFWLDTSTTVAVLKKYVSGSWKKATPTAASEVGAETPTGAQTKANTAQANAISAAAADALAKANKAFADAKTHADSVASSAEQAAKTHSNNVSSIVEAAAKAHADAVAASAISTAAIDALNKANIAKAEAIATAKTEAQALANAAKSAAEAAAKTHTDSVSATVEATAKAYAEQQAQASVGELEIGVRNYLLQSKEEKSTNNLLHYEINRGEMEQFVGSQFTISFLVKANNGSRNVDFYLRDSAAISGTQSGRFLIGGVYELVTFTFTLPNTKNLNPLTFSVRSNSTINVGMTGTSVTVKNVKLEKGTKATDYDEAPEDVQEYASDASNLIKGILAAERLYGTTIDGNQANIINVNAGNVNTGTLNASLVSVINLNASNITTGTLNASRIAANSITSTHINVTNLAAISANLGTVTAGTINASQVTITNLNASNITSGTLSASRIGANTITSTHINVTNLAAISANLGTVTAGTINASQVTITNLNASNITTGTLSAARVRIGAGTTFDNGYDPSKIEVYSLRARAYSQRNTPDTKPTGIINENGVDITGLNGHTGNDRSYTLAVYDRNTRNWISSTRYDVYTSPANATALAEALNALDRTKLVILIGAHAPRENRTTNGLPEAIYRCGGSKEIFEDTNWTGQPCYILVGIPGMGEGSGKEVFVEASVGVIEEQLIISNGEVAFGAKTINSYALASNANNLVTGWKYGNTTLIDGGNIYANTVTANAINVANLAAISANLGSITAGTIDASKVSINNLSASIIQTGILDASLVTVNKLNASNITTGTLSADRLAANSITTTHINVTNLASISANLGTITAGTINAATVTINNLNATNITSGTLNAARIGANTITSTHINVTNLAAISANLGTVTAGTINASQVTITNLNASNISTGTLSADRLAANSITSTHITVSNLASISANLGTVTAGTINASQVTITNLNASNISTGTLNAARIAANTITSTHISVTNLAAISANLGTITAGTLRTVTLDAATGTFSGSLESRYIDVRNPNFSQTGAPQLRFQSGVNTTHDSNIVIQPTNDGTGLNMWKTNTTFGNLLPITLKLYSGTLESNNVETFTSKSDRVQGRSVADRFNLGTGNVQVDAASNNLQFLVPNQFSISIEGTQAIYADRNVAAGWSRFKVGRVFLKGSDPSTSAQVLEVRNNADNGWTEIKALSFTPMSNLELKKNVEHYQEDALHEVLTTPVFKYNYLNDVDGLDRKKVGIAVQYAPVDIVDIQGKGIDLYGMTSLLWRAFQQHVEQQNAKIKQLEEEIELLKSA